jgi:hypothetical protein
MLPVRIVNKLYLDKIPQDKNRNPQEPRMSELFSLYLLAKLLFLKKGKLSSELAKQVELLNLDEEGYVILEYELK